MGCSPWGLEESGMTERLHFHFSLLCIGEGNGNPLQCSCLENPRDGGAWWAAVYQVAQSWTRLKRLSSSSGNRLAGTCCGFCHLHTNCQSTNVKSYLLLSLKIPTLAYSVWDDEVLFLNGAEVCFSLLTGI